MEQAVVERLMHVVANADNQLSNRTVDLLQHFPPSTEANTVVLMNALSKRQGQARWRAAIALAGLGVGDDRIVEHLQRLASTGTIPGGQAVKSVVAFDAFEYQTLYELALGDSASFERGRALENLAEYLFHSVSGLRLIARNLRTLAEEIDLAFSNGADGFWREIGNPFLVECKNLASAVGARIIRDFRVKLQTKGLRGGFIVATSRLTKDARVEIRQALSDGRAIVSVEGDHLEAIAQGQQVGRLLEDRFYTCRLL